MSCTDGDALRPQLADLELRASRVEGKLERLEGLARRVEGLEAALALPEARSSDARGDDQARLAAVEAKGRSRAKRLAELEARVAALEGQREERPDGVKILKHSPPTAPASGLALEVLAAGAGDLLLVRLPGGRLERVRLVGVDPPRAEEEYQADPLLRRRHRAAFRQDLPLDEAWEASRVHLEALVAGKQIRLRYPPGGSRRVLGAILAYVELGEGESARDVGAAIIRAGYALAGGEHSLKESYEVLARAATGLGLR